MHDSVARTPSLGRSEFGMRFLAVSLRNFIRNLVG